jgi:SAM-dependent methyltransferase
MTYFSHDTAAQRYAQSRPNVHPLVIARVRDQLKLTEPVALALDVACGTGRSTVALAEIAQRVVGTDISAEMLTQAPPNPRLAFLQASAENLPLADGIFDLVTVALAFHWLDRVRFLNEARRLLRTAGWLVLYNNAFTGTMQENPMFTRWWQDSYLARYPSPARHGAAITDKEAHGYGLRLVNSQDYTNDIVFSVEALARYLMTQSNIIAAVEQGTERSEAVYSWLLRELTPLFPSANGTFVFGGYLCLLQKTVGAETPER